MSDLRTFGPFGPLAPWTKMLPSWSKIRLAMNPPMCLDLQVTEPRSLEVSKPGEASAGVANRNHIDWLSVVFVLFAAYIF